MNSSGSDVDDGEFDMIMSTLEEGSIKKWLLNNQKDLTPAQMTKILTSTSDEEIRGMLSDNLKNSLLETVQIEAMFSNSNSKLFLVCDFKSCETYSEFLKETLNNLTSQDKAKILSALIMHLFISPTQCREDLLNLGFHFVQEISSSCFTDSEIKCFISTVINKCIKVINELREKRDELWHRLWIFLVRFLGKQVHNSVALANNLLRVAEYAFRDASDTQILYAYNCWMELIDNASLNQDHMCSHKQIKLLLKPLSANLSNMENTICKRFEVFLHLIEKLQSKATLCLEEVLFFCFGVSKNGTVKKCQVQSVPALWLKSTELLLAILGDVKHLNKTEKREVFTGGVINGNNIELFNAVIVNSVMECSCLLKSDKFKLNTQNKLNLFTSLWEALFKIIVKSNRRTQKFCFEIILNSFMKKKLLSDDFVLLGFISGFKCLVNSDLNFELYQEALEMLLQSSLNFVCEHETSDEFFHEFCDFVQACNLFKLDEFLLGKLKNLSVNDENQLKMFGIWNSIGCSMMNNSENETKVLVKLFLWPVNILHKFTGQLVEDVCSMWVKTYVLISDGARKIIVDEMETAFKSNPLLGTNIVSLISKLPQSELKFNDEFACHLLKLMSNVLSLPLLSQDCAEKLHDLLLKCIDSKLEDKNLEETVENICLCVGKLPDRLKTSKLLTRLEKIYSQSKTNVRIEKMMNEIRAQTQTENPQTQTNKSKRSSRISSKLRSKIDEQKPDKPNDFQLNGFNIEDAKEKIKEALFRSNSRSKRIVNSVRKPEPPSIDDFPSSDFVPINSDVKLEKDKLTEHQKEELKRRRDEIPALYQDLSQNSASASASTPKEDSQASSEASRLNKELMRIQSDLVGVDNQLPPKRPRKTNSVYSPELTGSVDPKRPRKRRESFQDGVENCEIKPIDLNIVQTHEVDGITPIAGGDTPNNGRKAKFVKPKKFVEDERNTKKRSSIGSNAKKLKSGDNESNPNSTATTAVEGEEKKEGREKIFKENQDEKRAVVIMTKEKEIVGSIEKLSDPELKKSNGSNKLIFIRELTNSNTPIKSEDASSSSPSKKTKKRSESPRIPPKRAPVPDSPTRITRSRASPSIISEVPRKILVEESEDVIESSQEVELPNAITKNIKNSSTPSKSDSLLNSCKVPIILLEKSPQSALPDTETCDSKYCEPIAPVLQLDLPEQPTLTDSQKELSIADTVSVTASPSESKISETQSLVLSPIPTRSSFAGNLTGSPENADTPTRNQQFLDSTVNLSPINQTKNEEVAVDMAPDSSTAILKQLEDAINGSAKQESSGRNGGAGGCMQNLRSNKLLSMVNVESPKTTTGKKIKKSSGKGKKSGSSAREKLFFGNLNSKEESVGDDNDCADETEEYLTFSREVPSPLVVPSSGILKRKLSISDAGYSPCPKRKRVNFSFPCISSTKLFLRQEDEDPFLEEHQQETEESMELTNHQLMCNSEPFFKELVDCDEKLESIFCQLTSPMLSHIFREMLMQKKIVTIGDLAKLSESEIERIPFRNPKLTTVRTVLENYYRDIYVTKPKPDENEINQVASISAKEELKNALMRIKKENTPAEELYEIFLDTTEEDVMVNLLKNAYNTNIMKFFMDSKEDLKKTIENLVQSDQAPQSSDKSSDSSETDHIFRVELKKAFQLEFEKSPLDDVISKRSMEDVGDALTRCISEGKFNREDVKKLLLIPLLELI